MEKAIIVGVNLNTSSDDFSQEMTELESLCASCDIEILDTVSQNLTIINPSFYVGKGKLEEIKTCIADYDLDVVVFNDELTPGQISNLEKELEITIYDRTFVILEIFKRRAKTKEAILQVELASLQYLLPRLVGMRKGLSRQRGTASNNAHGRGAGETKLELDRRYYTNRIVMIKNELQDLTLLRKQQRQKRQKQELNNVCLVGYTNSGKSTTLNSLMDLSSNIKKEVFEKDMLFATLETSTRLLKFLDFSLIITDTVGFIEKLPHQLVEAFKSTLEEITESSLIVHIVDSSNPNFEKQIKTTNEVLSEIGVKDIPMIYAFNKIDLVSDYLYIPVEYEKAIRISAKRKLNLDNLLIMIKEQLTIDYHDCTFLIPFFDTNIISNIKEKVLIKEIIQTEDGIKIFCKAPISLSNKYQEYKKETS